MVRWSGSPPAALRLALLLDLEVSEGDREVLLHRVLAVGANELRKVEHLLLLRKMIEEGDDVVEGAVPPHALHGALPLRDYEGVVGVLLVGVRLCVDDDDALKGPPEVLEVLFGAGMFHLLGDRVVQPLVLGVQAGHHVHGVVESGAGPDDHLVPLAQPLEKKIESGPLVRHPSLRLGVINGGDDASIEIEAESGAAAQVGLAVREVRVLHRQERVVQRHPNVFGVEPLGGGLGDGADDGPQERLLVGYVRHQEHPEGRQQRPLPVAEPVDRATRLDRARNDGGGRREWTGAYEAPKPRRWEPAGYHRERGGPKKNLLKRQADREAITLLKI